MEKLTIDQRKAAYKKLFETRTGNIVLDDLKKKFYVKGSIFNESHARMCYIDGNKEVIQHIIDIMDTI